MTPAATMKAAWYEARGPAREVLRVGTMPVPRPGPGQVRVKVAMSAVNPSDTKGRGVFLGVSAMPYPNIIPHQDGAGTIDAAGSGVPTARIGERAWLYMSQRASAFGTAAEYVVLPAARAVPLPTGASFADGACLGVPAMTAHYALLADGTIEGKTVLVQGGAGAVGWYAVQLAKWAGAVCVIATVSRPEQAERAGAAGADVVLNYREAGLIERVREHAPRGVDRIVEVDFNANQEIDGALIAPNGVVAAYASDSNYLPVLRFRDFMTKNTVLRTVLIYEAPQPALDAAARDINRCLEDGRLRHQVAQVYPLADIAAAHEAQESRSVVGKILVSIE
jgi:NADPH:quinone reductase